MTPNSRRPPFVRLVLLFLATLPATGSPPPEEFTAVISQARGSVEVLGSGVRDLPTAHLWQIVSSGASLRVGEDGFAGVACSNRRFVRIPGPKTWPVSRESCAQGTPLTEAQYSLVAPEGGRFRVVADLLVIDRRLRGDARGDDQAPVVVGPRNSIVRSPRPTIFWTPVSTADEYSIEWRRDDGGRGVPVARFSATISACQKNQEGVALCRLSWPDGASDLSPDRPYLLSISARDQKSGIWHAEPPVAVATLSLNDGKRLDLDLGELDSLGLEGPVLQAARGGLLASRGLFSDAAAAYRAAISEAPSPELRVTLADLYLETELHDLAEPLYRENLEAPSLTIRAAAAFGLGRVAYEKRDFGEAASRFAQARATYAELGSSEEEAAAAQAEKKAAERAAKQEMQEKPTAAPGPPSPGSVLANESVPAIVAEPLTSTSAPTPAPAESARPDRVL